MKITFNALIKSITSKSLVSGDKSVRVILEVDNPDSDTLTSVNLIHQADKWVMVTLEGEENASNQG